MKKRVFFGLLILVPLFISCKTNESVKSRTIINDLVVSHDFVSQKTNTILFSIENLSDSKVTLFNPTKTVIEKQVGEEWINIRILYCPCGASCPPPPEERLIIKGVVHQLKWNLKEEWCGGQNKEGIPSTISNIAESGNYRIKIDYEKVDGNRTFIYHEFSIK